VGLAAARQRLVQDLAAEVGSLAPNGDSPEPVFPRSATLPTLAEATNAQDSYFRDHRSLNFVDEVLHPPGPVRTLAARLLAPLVGAAVLAIGVFIVKAATVVSTPAAMPEVARSRPDQTPPQTHPAAPSHQAPSTFQSRAAPKSTSTRASRTASEPRVRAPVVVPPAGEVTIQCSPWCVPFLDGKAMANDGRSFVLRDVSPGRHRVEVRRLEDHQRRDVDVAAGGREALEFQFD
jgi:hypothetical protein